MKGKIGFKNHQILCIIGVHENERTDPQPIFVDLTVEADFSQCAKSDQIEEAIDYTALASLCQKMAVTGKYRLLEAYAYAVVKALMEIFPVKKVSIQVKKPEALPFADYAFVSLSEEKNS